MLSIMLWTRHKFDTQDKAAALFNLLNEVGGTFTPSWFDNKEPIRKEYTKDDLSEPIKLLSGHPKYLGGGLLLKGSNYKYKALFNWNMEGISTWHIYLSKAYFKSPTRIEEFLHFISQLNQLGSNGASPLIYGAAAPKEEWSTKHWLVKRRPGGRKSRKKAGLELKESLPGIYWFTIFGEELVEFFGREKIESLPVSHVFDLGQNGIGVLRRDFPFTPENDLCHDHEIMARLGSQYFFDINDLEKQIEAIPGITLGKSHPQRRQLKAKTPNSLNESMFNKAILSPHGEPYTIPGHLAAQLVVYLHTEVEEVFTKTGKALSALDHYLAIHPQQIEYKPAHLMEEFIPALGAYLGEVLVKELGGQWIVRKPIGQSVVKINGHEISPFRQAYQAIYENAKLKDVYDSAAS